jgi:hypothetical protein
MIDLNLNRHEHASPELKDRLTRLRWDNQIGVERGRCFWWVFLFFAVILWIFFYSLLLRGIKECCLFACYCGNPPASISKSSPIFQSSPLWPRPRDIGTFLPVSRGLMANCCKLKLISYFVAELPHCKS